MRRKFVEAQKEAPQAVQFVLRLIGNLHEMERSWDETRWTDPKWRTALGRRDFAPVLGLLKRGVLKWCILPAK